MILRNPFHVTCKNCGKEISVDMPLDCTSAYERKMGFEKEYEGVYESECPNCEADVAVRLEVWEYPENVINDWLISADGAECSDVPDIEAE